MSELIAFEVVSDLIHRLMAVNMKILVHLSHMEEKLIRRCSTHFPTHFIYALQSLFLHQ